MRIVLLLAVAVALAANALALNQRGDERPKEKVSYACSNTEGDQIPFCRKDLSVEERVSDLVSRLSLEEKISQLVNGASNISRLGIPAYQWWSEALHGVGSDGPGVHFGDEVPAATTFPQVILTAASFNRTLWNLIAQAVSSEARAMYNVGLAGLTYWSPNLNIFRDPRWGRGQETPGEDPLLTSEYGVAYVRGLQGQLYNEEQMLRGVLEEERNEPGGVSGSLKLSACCKHYTAYDLEAWGGFTRYTFDALVSDQDLADTYQPPFKSCVKYGQATCIMCSYNRINGVPACANENLLTYLARQEWGFKGYITSDCDAVAVVYEYIGYASSPEGAVADCLNAGLDLNCGTYILRHAATAIEKKMVNISVVDKALSYLFMVQMQLGLFDGDPKTQPYGSIGTDIVCSGSHRQLALEAARQGLVLLKNEENTLPLSKEHVAKLAVIGPNANATDDSLLGSYAGIPCSIITALQGLQSYVDVIYQPGCINVSCVNDSMVQAAVDIGSTEDAVVIIAGLDQSQEREDHDRLELVLPGYQEELICRVAKSAKSPVILVIFSGGPIDITVAVDNPKIQSILWAGYPGELGGLAIAEVIFGDFSPGGRLPITWYPASFANVPMTDMNMRPDSKHSYPGRTYRFYKGDVVFPFGYGLSFTVFDYYFVSVPSEVVLSSCLNGLSEVTDVNVTPLLCYASDQDISTSETLRVNVTVRVSNMGSRPGSDSLLLFSKQMTRDVGAPQKQLIGFKKVYLEEESSADVTFIIDLFRHLSVVNTSGRKVLSVGSHTLIVNDKVEHTIVVRTWDPKAQIIY